MINQFAYSRASSSEDADRQLAAAGAAPLGGGTDLLVCIREHLARPETLVDLTRIPGRTRRDRAATMAGCASADPCDSRTWRATRCVRDRFPALAQACESVGTPALRTMGTIAGNLCQRPRCWYLRSGFACHKNGGDSCPAASGENQYHAILGGGPCYIVHPSDRGGRSDGARGGGGDSRGAACDVALGSCRSRTSSCCRASGWTARRSWARAST